MSGRCYGCGQPAEFETEIGRRRVWVCGDPECDREAEEADREMFQEEEAAMLERQEEERDAFYGR